MSEEDMEQDMEELEVHHALDTIINLINDKYNGYSKFPNNDLVLRLKRLREDYSESIKQ